MRYSNITTAFLFCSVFCTIIADGRDIYVSPSGNVSSNCSKEAKCKTLDRALQLASGLNSSRIFASKGNYSLKTSHNFTRVSSFGLFGKRSRDDVQITCEPNVSLSFTLSENITFEGVRFQKCGGWHEGSVDVDKNYPNLKGARFKTALHFRYCRNLRMSNVEISLSPGRGANLYDVGGVVNFTDSLFADNYASHDNINITQQSQSGIRKYIYSGGGLFVQLNPYGYDTVNVTPSKHDSYQHNNSYEFTNCHFIRNKALWLNANEETELNTPERPFSRGGGLAVYFLGIASGCLIKIQSCNFTGNKASWGGGLQVETKDKTENNSLIVEATEFRENYAMLSGGGARIGNVALKGAQLRLNRFYMTNCSFVNNKAIWGGGTSLYGTTIPRKCVKHTDPAVTQFFLCGCRWQGNKGNVGAAMGAYLYNQNEDQIGPETPFHVCFQNDTMFRSNKVVLLHHNLTSGQGTLYSEQVPLIFRSDVQFINNTQSALVLDGSAVDVHDRLHFINNTGIRGGAIAMYGRSRIILYENTSSITFEANKCEDKGGALYIQAPGPPLVTFNATQTYNPACFFGYSNSSKVYDEWKTSVIFKDNSASLGNSVYATTLKKCRQAGEGRQGNDVLKWNFVKFDNLPQNNNTSLLGEVATDPVVIRYNRKDWRVAPGEIFNATIHFFDEVGNCVPGIVNIDIDKSSSVSLINPSSLFLATDSIIKGIGLSGQIGSIFSVKLSYIGSQLLETTIDNVTLKKCYAGFIFNKGTSRCKCMSSTQETGARGVSNCGDDGRTVYVKGGYWAGYVGENFTTYFCPTGYCNSSTSNDYQYFEGHVCNEFRNQKSVLCGECKSNYSISFGSERCLDSCTYWHLFYILAIGLGFLLLVIIVMLIDLDIVTGYLNAWLYSYQIMKLLTPDGFEFDPFIEFVIAFTNVHVETGRGHSFCLAKGLDDADKLILMYAIPFYVLVVVGLLKWLVDCYPDWCFSRRVLRSTPSAPFRAVCTILVFCYTDITRISLKILDPAKVGSRTVLYNYGSLEMFHGKHLWYGIVAIIWIVSFVLPFPLILLFRPFLTKRVRPVLNLNRWKLYFDAFQGCFKDQYRWCAAFYFLCRLGILLIHTYLPASSTKRVVIQSACILILFFFALLRPYKEASDVKQNNQDSGGVNQGEHENERPIRRSSEGDIGDGQQKERSYEWINKSDVVLLTNLSLICVISSPLDTDPSDQGFKIAVNILAYVPLVVLLALGLRMLRNYYWAADINVPQDDETAPIMSETSHTSHGSCGVTPETSLTQRSSRESHSSVI